MPAEEHAFNPPYPPSPIKAECGEHLRRPAEDIRHLPFRGLMLYFTGQYKPIIMVIVNNKMAPDFKIIDHTADIGIAVHAADLGDLFAKAALGLFNLITYVYRIKPEIKRKVEIMAADTEELLVEWLNELIYIFEVEHVLFCDFNILEISENSLNAICTGEKINQKHIIKREVKAATYHMLHITRVKDEFRARIIFDL